MKTLVKTTALAALAASCVASPEPQDTSAESTTATNEELTVYTQTIVTMKEDGTYEITSKPITLAQEIAENKIRGARAAGNFVQESDIVDSSCAGSSEWLYDQTGFFGNKICFKHPPANSGAVAVDDLAQFTRGSLSCGGVSFPLRWAAGAIACSPATGGVIFAPSNTNFVRSIWTGFFPNGSINLAGVCFRNDSPNGPQQGCYMGDNTQFSNVSTSGRYLVTWAATIVN